MVLSAQFCDDIVASCAVGSPQVVPGDRQGDKTNNERNNAENIRHLH